MDATNKADDLSEPGAHAEDAGFSLLDDLRAIVAGPDREKLATLEARIADVEHRTGDHEALVAAVSPILSDAIRKQVREDRDAMVESLYPLIGQLISRAVAESIRDLARTIDLRMRTSFSPAALLRRAPAARCRRLRCGAGATRRAAVPRHRVVSHSSRNGPAAAAPRSVGHGARRRARHEGNADLVSGMLTAIRDFAQDAFGRGREGGLDEIQYGDRRILIEAAQHIYLAAVVDGVEQAGFRSRLRDSAMEVENAYNNVLRQYDGDASRLAPAEPQLAGLLGEGGNNGAEPGLTSGQKRIVALGGAVLILCMLAACVASVVAAGNALRRPAYIVVITATFAPTATPSATPTATMTPAPTRTATPSPTATSTRTATPSPSPTATRTRGPSPVASVLLDANLRTGPGLASIIIEQAPAGQRYQIIGRDAAGAWLQVCCATSGQPGWLAAALVTFEGSIEDVPVIEGR